MLAIVPSAVVEGVYGAPVSVEVMLTSGLPTFTMVGLPGTSVRESRDRVHSALVSSGLEWPKGKLTVNLAPSELPKHGASLDLAIALGILVASKQLEPADIANVGAVGELGLDGSVRRVPGLVSMADAVAGSTLLVPFEGAIEAAVVRPGDVRGATDLREVVDGLRGLGPLPPLIDHEVDESTAVLAPDLADVRGQALARFGLELAAAGGHHLLMVGPPGAGKTMLAARIRGLLPAMATEDALLATRVHSVAGLSIPPSGLVRMPPFRAPHHGASGVAMIGGGGAAIRPGEISCAHGGVLFLDELGEFPVAVLEALRQPLEEGVIRVSRASGSVVLPAQFQLVGAMNPCPCGQGGGDGLCRCSDAARARYARRLSAPLLDRFDLRIDVQTPDPLMLLDGPPEESTADVAARVQAARDLAAERGVRCNAMLPASRLDEVAPLAPSGKEVLETALRTGRLTGRGLRRVRTVARTVADLEDGRLHMDAAAINQALALRANPVSVLGGVA